jgi:hypothetical protein
MNERKKNEGKKERKKENVDQSRPWNGIR